MKISRYLLAALVAATWLVVQIPAARAVALSLAPPASVVTEGDTFSIDVLVSGLGDAVAPSLATFDMTITYDSALLLATGVVFGDPVLGDQLDLFGIGTFPGSVFDVGTVDISEASFDSPSDLDSMQAPAFILATIDFKALAATSLGAATLLGIVPTPGFNGPLLGDSLGVEIAVAAATTGAEVTIKARNVAEPGTLALLGLSLMGMTFLRWRGVSA